MASSAVDARTGAHVTELLRELSRRGQTLLLVTHDPELARRCAGSVTYLSDGRIVGGPARGAAAPAARGAAAPAAQGRPGVPA